MPAEYTIEVYLPNSERDVWISFTSSSPFMAVGVGDLINPAAWGGYGNGPKTKVRVVAVEHVISEDGGLHKVLVFTKPA